MTVIVSSLFFSQFFTFFLCVSMGLPVVPDPFLIIRQIRTSEWDVLGNS